MTIEYEAGRLVPCLKFTVLACSIHTPWPFWTGILSQVSKNDDEKSVAS